VFKVPQNGEPKKKKEKKKKKKNGEHQKLL